MSQLLQTLQKIASDINETIEKYALRTPKAPKPGKGQQEFHWVQIGAEPGPDGKKTGGHPVMIDKQGVMQTGKFAGQTMGQAFGGGKGNAPEKPDSSKPAIQPVTRPNESAKAGDQLGLFGQAGAPKRDKAPELAPGGESKGKQRSLFDTKGSADQVMLFATDDATPDDMVGKPAAKARPKVYEPAIVNLPLDKRGGGSLDSQIDRAKQQDAESKKTKKKADSARRAEDKAIAQKLYDKHGAVMVKSFAERKGENEKEVAKMVDSMIKWEPTKARQLMEKYEKEQKDEYDSIVKRMDEITASARAVADKSDPALRGLRPSEYDWMTPEQAEEMQQLQRKLTTNAHYIDQNSPEAAKKRVMAKRAERAAAKQEVPPNIEQAHADMKKAHGRRMGHKELTGQASDEYEDRKSLLKNAIDREHDMNAKSRAARFLFKDIHPDAAEALARHLIEISPETYAHIRNSGHAIAKTPAFSKSVAEHRGERKDRNSANPYEIYRPVLLKV